MRSHGVFVRALGLALGLACACKSEPSLTLVAAASASAGSVPVDHLAPGELLEGKAKVFGLVLPRVMRIDAAFGDVVYASGQVPPDSVAKYVRARVREGKMIEGDFAHYGTTTFEHVKIPEMPDKDFAIIIRPAAEGVGITKLEVRDVTAPQAPALPSDDARWKNAGLGPNGRILDPTHLQ